MPFSGHESCKRNLNKLQHEIRKHESLIGTKEYWIRLKNSREEYEPIHHGEIRKLKMRNDIKSPPLLFLEISLDIWHNWLWNQISNFHTQPKEAIFNWTLNTKAGIFWDCLCNHVLRRFNNTYNIMTSWLEMWKRMKKAPLLYKEFKCLW